MIGTVPIISIVFMILMAVVIAAIPIILLVYFHKKGADIVPFFVGCAVFLIFALILEAIVHRIVILASPAGPVIQGSVALSAIYGGIMAGLFEEIGRFTAFKTVLKKFQNKDINAFMYGAGHGGFEAVAIYSLTMITNTVISFMINSGAIDAITAAVPEEQLPTLIEQFNTLSTTPFYTFVLGGVERILAMTFHIELSILVWFAAKNKGKGYLLFLAIFLHAFMDGVTVVMSGSGVNVVLIEAVIAVLVIFTAFVSRRVWEKNYRAA